jgi:hypothetical protein
MTDPHPNDLFAYQEWVNQLEQKWQAGLIPDPQAVAVIVQNDRGQVLLQLRDNNPKIPFANSGLCPAVLLKQMKQPRKQPNVSWRKK